MMQALFMHAGVAFASAQAMPQPPQLATLLVVSISQPSAGCALQSAKPAWHIAILHWPAAHVGDACGVTQTLLHAPQFMTSSAMSISQPSAGILLQSAKPASHACTAHAPFVHCGVACESMQAMLQAPQLVTVVL